MVDVPPAAGSPGLPFTPDERADYRSIRESQARDYEIQERHMARHRQGTPDLYLRLLAGLATPHLGFPIDRLEHSLQTASRALRDGRDELYVFAALFHDVGDAVAPANHPEAGAAMLRPYVSDDLYWMVRHHGSFQGYYYWHFLGRDRDAREKYRDHRLFGFTAEFCELYDQAAFDRDYRSLSLADFEPLVREVMSRPRNFVPD
ncbi:HD domain-containing protein [Tistrella mobilis]|uniref:Metal-dependent phosphohydrolase n=1 Tax=Tistrella mobilis (strain KA081020-065) TaxID=1110502 RepID=I3TTE6_TISMK|nr:HD domain-containing protein [Tistrella mobilis]AFK56034.1 metal-dependent phosphohydrolase [Tistrella mobilis KA081020-065]